MFGRNDNWRCAYQNKCRLDCHTKFPEMIWKLRWGWKPGIISVVRDNSQMPIVATNSNVKIIVIEDFFMMIAPQNNPSVSTPKGYRSDVK